MLILATVAINAAINGDGLFARAKKAVDETTIATYEENIEVARMLALLDKQQKGGGGITVNELIDKLIEQGFVKEGNVTRPTEEDKNGYVEKDGLIFELKKGDNGDITVEYVGETDNIVPTIKTALSSETATSKVTVSVTGKEQINGLASIEQKGGDKKTYDELVKEKTEEFEITENGDYTFIVTSKIGKTAEETIKIGNIDKDAPTGEHTLNPEEGSWGKTVEITVTGKDANGIKQITDPDGKVSMGEKCTYTAKENKEYKFLIKDTLENEAEYKVQVNNVDIVEPSGRHIISPEKGEYGETVEITVTGEDSQSGVKQITDPDGKVSTGETCKYTAKENKTYTFVIEDNVENKKNYDVTIENILIPVQSITLNTQSLSLKEEESDTLTATVQPDNATDKTVSWRSEEDGIATVEDHEDGTATVKGVKAGSTNIVATAGKQSVSCKVEVKLPLHNVTITKDNYKDYLGKVVTNFSSNSINSTNTVGTYKVGNKFRLYYVDFADADHPNGKYGDGAGTIYLKADSKLYNTYSLPTTDTTDIDSTKMKQLNPELYKTTSPNENNSAMRGVKWLLNPTNWSSLKENSPIIDSVNYVVGAPSVEMMMDSYNEYYNLKDTATSPQIGVFQKKERRKLFYRYTGEKNGYEIGPYEDQEWHSQYTPDNSVQEDSTIGYMYNAYAR